MKLQCLLSIALLALGLVVLQDGVQAGDKDKKDPPKDKKDPPKDKKDPPKKEAFKDITVMDALTNADLKDKVRTTSYCKTYVLKMTQGKTYQIDMISTDFDSYLRLENFTGEQVAADDDGGGFPNARIVFQCPKTEDYTIIATTFGGSSTGKYRVLVKEVK